MVNGIAGGFRKMLDGAVNWGDTFKNIIKDIIAQLIKVLVVQKAVNALAGAIGGSGGSDISSSVASAGTGSITSGATSVLSKQRGLNVNVVNNANATVGIQERGGDLNVIIDAVNNDIANGIQRNTSPISQALESSYGLSR